MHKQIQIAPGVYITDFRKDQDLVGLGDNTKNQLTNDVGLLLDQVQTLQSKILQLEYSIKEIQSEQNWQSDPDFVEAIEQNWECIVRFSYQMKEKVLRLYELKYHPQSQKIEQLLKIHRIEQRQNVALQQVKKNIEKFTKRQQKAKQLAKVESNSDQEKDQEKGKKSKQQKQQKQEDQGVFI